MNRFLFILWVLLVPGCQSVTEKVVVVNKAPEEELLVNVPDSLELIEEKKAAFESLLSKAVAQRQITPDDKESMTLVRRFFPNTFRFENQHVSVEPIATRDSFWLLLYEFISEKEEQNQMFLGSFSKSGEIIDLLEIQSVSYDGHFSLNLLDNDILEIEYRDFIIQSNFPNIQANHDRFNAHVLPVNLAHDQGNLIELKNGETAGTKYFRINRDGTFVSLTIGNRDNIQRVFPEVSSRILTVEELRRLKPDEIELMRNEIFASYGFKFEDVLLEDYFIEKGWYQPTGEVDLEKLSEVEKINLNKMLNLE